MSPVHNSTAVACFRCDFQLLHVSRYWARLRHCSFVRCEISSSNISKTVWARIIKFYRHIHTDIVYSSLHRIWRHYLLPVGSYSEKNSKMPPPTASGEISPARFNPVSWNLQAYRGQAAPKTCQKWRQQLIPVGCKKMLLNTAKKVRKTGPKCRERLNSEMVQDTANF